MMKKIFKEYKYVPIVTIILLIISITLASIVGTIKSQSKTKNLSGQIKYSINDQINLSLYKLLDMKTEFFYDYAIKSIKNDSKIVNSSFYYESKDGKLMIYKTSGGILYSGEKGETISEEKDDGFVISGDGYKKLVDFSGNVSVFYANKEINETEKEKIEDGKFIYPRYLTNMEEFSPMDPRKFDKKIHGLIIKGSYENKKLNPITISRTYSEDIFKKYDKNIIKSFEKSVLDAVTNSYSNIDNTDIISLYFYYGVDYSSENFAKLYNNIIFSEYYQNPVLISGYVFLIAMALYGLLFDISVRKSKYVKTAFRIPAEVLFLLTYYFFFIFLIHTNYINLTRFDNTFRMDGSLNTLVLQFYIFALVASAFVFLSLLFLRDILKNRTKSQVVEYSLASKISRVINKNFSLENLSNIKILIIYILFIFAGIIGIESVNYAYRGNIFAIWFILITIFAIYFATNAKDYKKIMEYSKYLAEGNFENNLEEIDGYEKVVENLNRTGRNLDNILSEKLDSEKLKSELITNVSHDLKTPLTSVINYSTLLKDENLSLEDRIKYAKIVNQKSMKIKYLIEDLFEISKISSGEIDVHKVDFELNEMLLQMIGEWEDKFKERGLEIISSSSSAAEVNLDPDLMYRVFQNIFSNIYKYALENTRVYVDLFVNQEIAIIFKNISKEELNLSSKELLERFVRGDSSRKTEGAGLGLSIAKSLVEVQDGEFYIDIDGDLFKQSIVFKNKIIGI